MQIGVNRRISVVVSLGDEFRGTAGCTEGFLRCKSTVEDSSLELLQRAVVSAGHLQIQSVSDGGNGITDSAPIGEECPLKTPAVPGGLIHEPAVFRAVGSVQFVVGGHDRPGLGTADDAHELKQIQFHQRAPVHDAVRHHATVFLRIGGKVLDACTDTMILKTLYQRNGHLTGYHRIFGEIFEVSAAERAPLVIDAGTQKDLDILFLSFFGQSFSYFIHQFPVKRACQCRSSGIAYRRLGGSHGQTGGLPGFFPEPVGSVGHANRAHVLPGNGVSLPEIRSAEELQLLVHAQGTAEFLSLPSEIGVFSVVCHDFTRVSF